MNRMIQSRVRTPDGRTLHAYDTGGTGSDPDGAGGQGRRGTGGETRLTVVWQHGTPNIGVPPEPLLALSATLGIRWIGYDRPGYAGSTRSPGRTVGSAAADVVTVADALGVERFAVMGHSGGGSHALGCAALRPDRVLAAVAAAPMAPMESPGLNYFEDMAASGVTALSTAAQGLEATEALHASGARYDPEFTPADLAALEGEWSWFGSVVQPAVAAGPAGHIDDDLAYARPWGFDPADVRVPVLLLHGGRDRIAPPGHSRWLATRCPTAELWDGPDDGHISIIRFAPAALRWLLERVAAPAPGPRRA